ncbi:15076_t:CDS:1, partial [Dentiscutata heterogama]
FCDNDNKEFPISLSGSINNIKNNDSTTVESNNNLAVEYNDNLYA